MYKQYRLRTDCDQVMSILNYNVVREENMKAAIQAMGMASCQVKCLRCTHCSDNKCGNRS